MTRRAAPKTERCCCDECARLDLTFPGEGLQLAFTLPKKPSRSRARRKEAVA